MTEKLIERIAYELWADMINPRPSIEDYRVRTEKDYQKEGKKFAKYLINITLKEAGYVKLADNQALPIPSLGIPHSTYECYQELLKAGWRKVEMKKLNA